jgi:osmoprotectant transport system substrate-binding protein
MPTALRPIALLATLLLVLVACGGTTDERPIVVSSFNFPESEILGEIYAQALEDEGYPVERSLNLGSRELIYPDLLEGGIACCRSTSARHLVVWFDEDPPADVDSGLAALRAAFADQGVEVLEPAPRRTTRRSWSPPLRRRARAVVDRRPRGRRAVTFAGPPECEGAPPATRGWSTTYGLDEIDFEAIQEAAARLAALDAGDAEVILLFSTDAPLAGDDYVVLEDTAGMLPPENITPVVRTEVMDLHGDGVRDVLATLTAQLTTDALQQMNADASAGEAPRDIARRGVPARSGTR